MTINREDIVTAVVDAAGSTLTSRVRLQKSVYLLDQLGLDSGFDYEYYHYGPYSRELDNATADAKAVGQLKEDYVHRQSDGAMYSIFSVKGQSKPEALGHLDPATARRLMDTFVKTNVTVLEIAATVDWLWRFERRKDWQTEVIRRKGVKARPERLAKAIELLEKLDLPPPASTAT